MESVDNFKRVIQEYLNNYALGDIEFSEKMKDENKSIDKCCDYIINTVQKSGRVAFTDDEVFGMAIHYYDEKDIQVEKAASCNIVSNHQAELTEEDKAIAKQKALEELVAQEKKKLAKPTTTSKPKPIVQQQPTLFDF